MNDNDRLQTRTQKYKRRMRIERYFLNIIGLVEITVAIILLLVWIAIGNDKQEVKSDIYNSPSGMIKETITVLEDEEANIIRVEEENSNALEKPIVRTSEEILVRLNELAKNNEDIRYVVENYKFYPQELMGALANNFEMASFARNYPGTDSLQESVLSEREMTETHPLFLQWDQRWGYHPYGSSVIGLTGCGPTCLAMVMYYLTRNAAYTPDVVADYSMKNGYYVEGSGTAWSLMEDYPKKSGITVTTLPLMESRFVSELDSGNLIICAMGRGDFTTAGHYIVIYGYDEEGFYVNDPNCISRSVKKWKFEDIKWQIKSIWAYGEGEKHKILKAVSHY